LALDEDRDVGPRRDADETGDLAHDAAGADDARKLLPRHPLLLRRRRSATSAPGARHGRSRTWRAGAAVLDVARRRRLSIGHVRTTGGCIALAPALQHPRRRGAGAARGRIGMLVDVIRHQHEKIGNAVRALMSLTLSGPQRLEAAASELAVAYADG